MAVSTLAIYAIGVLAPFLVEDMGLTRGQIGFLTTVLFAVGAVFSPIAGRWVDLYGGRAVLLALFGLALAGTGLFAAAPHYGFVLGAMVLAGAAMGAGNPSTNDLVARNIGRERQGAAIGVKQAGVPVATLLVGAYLPFAADLVGWRVAVLTLGILPLAGIAATLAVVPAKSTSPHLAGVLGTGRQPGAAWIVAYAFTMGAGIAPVTAYLPLYGYEVVGLTVGEAGFLVAMIGIVGGVSRIVWGFGVGRFPHTAFPLALLAAGAAIAAGGMGLAEVAGPWLLWTASVAYGTTAIAWNALGMAAVVSQTELGNAGRLSGHVVLGFYAGFIPSPMVVGYMLDRTGSYVAAWGLVTGAFLSAVVVALRWRRTM